MKLSEKLAALEHEDAREAKAAPAPASSAAKRARPIKSKGATTWDANKRKVRELVMDEVAPKMAGLVGEALAAEVKSALDKILQREDVQVTPARAPALRPGGHVRHPRLRPARPAPRRRDRHRGHVQLLRRHLGGARGPPRADRALLHR